MKSGKGEAHKVLITADFCRKMAGHFSVVISFFVMKNVHASTTFECREKIFSFCAIFYCTL